MYLVYTKCNVGFNGRKDEEDEGVRWGGDSTLACSLPIPASLKDVY